MPGRTRHLLAAIVLSVVVTQSAFAANGFSKLVVFGDSLNDSGNMVQFTGGVFPAPPLYAYGRQSNGPVWVEHLAKRLGLEHQLLNYAVVGALTKATAQFPTGNVWSEDEINPIPGLEGTDVYSQVLHYLADANWQADPAALYVLEGGSNDLMYTPELIVPNQLETLFVLQSYGARHIVLVNIPDVGKSPRYVTTPLSGYISAACGLLNEALMAYLPAVTLPGVRITIGDMYGFLDSVAADPEAYGLTNVQQAYLTDGAGQSPTTWLFWDDYHPTTVGHELFAEDVEGSLLGTYSPSKGRIGQGEINSLHGLVKTH